MVNCTICKSNRDKQERTEAALLASIRREHALHREAREEIRTDGPQHVFSRVDSDGVVWFIPWTNLSGSGRARGPGAEVYLGACGSDWVVLPDLGIRVVFPKGVLPVHREGQEADRAQEARTIALQALACVPAQAMPELLARIAHNAFSRGVRSERRRVLDAVGGPRRPAL